MMLPVGVVLCMPGQNRVFPPLVVTTTSRRCGILASRRCRRFTVNMGLPCGSIGIITTEQKPVVDGFPDSLHFIQNPLPCRQGLPRSPRGLVWHQVSSSNMPLEDAVDCSMSQPPATSNSTFPHALIGKCKHFMRSTHSGWTRYYYNIQWELRKRYELVDWNLPQCEGRFGEWLPKLLVWTSTIPLGIEVKVRPKLGRISLGTSHRYISYGDASEIIQSYFTSCNETWIEIFRQHCSWSRLTIFELILGMTSPGGKRGPQLSRHALYKDLHLFRGHCAPSLGPPVTWPLW